MKNRGKRTIELPTIRVGIVAWTGIITFFISLFLVTLFWHFSSERELLTFTTTVLASSATVISAVYIAQGLKQNVEFAKLNRAIELAERWNSPDFSNVKEITIELGKTLSNLPNDLSVEERLKVINNALDIDNKKETALINTFNFFEEIAILTNKKLLEEEVLREFYSFIIIRYYSQFEPWIQDRRAKSQRSTLYSNLEIMYYRWTKAA